MKKIIIVLLTVMSFNMFADTIGVRNNNPGNVKKPGSDTWVGTIGYDQYGHTQFESLDYGVRVLYINFRTRQKNHPEMTLGHYFSKVYAEENGMNEAQYIADKQGVTVNTKLKDVDLVKMTSAVCWFESRMIVSPNYVKNVVKKFDL